MTMPRAAAVLIVAGLAAACGRQTTTGPIADATLPSGFVFSMTQPVEIRISALAQALPPGGSGRLELSGADGQLLYRGTVRADKAVAVRLAVPTKDAQLVATLSIAGHAPTQVRVPIKNAQASWSFR